MKIVKYILFLLIIVSYSYDVCEYFYYSYYLYMSNGNIIFTEGMYMDEINAKLKQKDKEYLDYWKLRAKAEAISKSDWSRKLAIDSACLLLFIFLQNKKRKGDGG